MKPFKLLSPLVIQILNLWILLDLFQVVLISVLLVFKLFEQGLQLWHALCVQKVFEVLMNFAALLGRQELVSVTCYFIVILDCFSALLAQNMEENLAICFQIICSDNDCVVIIFCVLRWDS